MSYFSWILLSIVCWGLAFVVLLSWIIFVINGLVLFVLAGCIPVLLGHWIKCAKRKALVKSASIATGRLINQASRLKLQGGAR